MSPQVLHVIPFLWSGAGSVVTRLCEAQRPKGPVAIVTTGRLGAQPDWQIYRARLRRAGVEHHEIDFFHRDSATYWSSVERLLALVRRLRPAVIHAHAGVPAGAASIARAASGRSFRVIGQMYSWGPDRPEWMNQQDVTGFSQCDRVIVSARAYQKLLAGRGIPAAKLTYVPWGLSLDSLRLRVEPHRTGGTHLGFVGRIEPRKGQLALVEAFAKVVKTHPEARLTLVGPVADERYAAAVRSTIERRRLGGVVSVKGELQDVAHHMRQWDLFVSLSSDEGQGLAVLEAMALGVPVVARPVAGIADYLVHHQTGFATGASVSAAADSIVEALSNPSRLTHVAHGARRMVERRYSWDRTLESFDRLYWHRRSTAVSRKAA